MQTLDLQECENARKLLTPHNFHADATAERPKQAASQPTAANLPGHLAAQLVGDSRSSSVAA
jgi:hypothetical protein